MKTKYFYRDGDLYLFVNRRTDGMRMFLGAAKMSIQGTFGMLGMWKLSEMSHVLHDGTTFAKRVKRNVARKVAGKHWETLREKCRSLNHRATEA